MSIVSCIQLLLAAALLLPGCKRSSETPGSNYIAIAPEYDRVDISLSADSVVFPLGEYTYNRIKSFNLFTHNGIHFMSFYDKRSGKVAVYDFRSKKEVATIPLDTLFRKSESRKLSAYVWNFDSIFVATSRNLSLIDSTGKRLKTIDFLRQPKYSWAEIESDAPLFFKNGHCFTAVAPFADQKSLSSIKNWRLIYDFDLSNDRASLYYGYPERYSNALYGSIFLAQSHCINDKGRFVFSFRADSCIYETDLGQINNAYLAKSEDQHGDIQPFSAADLEIPRQRLKNFLIRDTYASIYFDPFRKRYLRVMRAGISEADYAVKVRSKEIRIVILDEHFRIIGESTIPPYISVSAIFFGPDGKIYARANERDEHAIHFRRLVYSDDQSPSNILAGTNTTK